jgi:hypothetical protein
MLFMMARRSILISARRFSFSFISGKSEHTTSASTLLKKSMSLMLKKQFVNVEIIFYSNCNYSVSFIRIAHNSFPFLLKMVPGVGLEPTSRCGEAF